MKRVTLTKDQSLRMDTDRETASQELAAEEYGYKTYLAEDFDAARETGAVLEVKSASVEISGGARGRFRLFKPQHDRLVARDRNGSATYVFVLWDNTVRPSVAYLTSRQPADVGRLIGGRGGWNRSGHPAGKHQKIPYSEFFGDV
jgi:hypothetical protein